MSTWFRQFRSHARTLAVLFASSAALTASAQVPTSVDIDLVDNSSTDSLEVRLRANGSGFSELVTGLTFTIAWPSTSAATLGARTMPCFDGIPLAPVAQITDGALHYVTYNAFSISLLSDACPDALWPAGEWVVLMRVKVNGLDGCIPFNAVNDAYTAAENRDYYISLNGLERTGVIDPTEDVIGSCGEDCEGIQGGAALPGTARIALAARDGTRPASRALLADTGAGGRLTTWRATRLASCSAASWGLETLSPPGAAAAARIGKTGVCTRTGAATAWCSGARRA